MRDSIVKQYNMTESCGKELMVHREESNYCSVLRITGASSTHSQMDRNLPDLLLFMNGDRSQKAKKIRGFTGKTHVFNSVYNDDQKSSIRLTFTIRNRHTPTTFTSIQLTMTSRNRHTPTTFNYPCTHILTNETCTSRVSTI